MTDNYLSFDFTFNTIKVVSEQLVFAAENAQHELQRLQNQEHFDLQVLGDLYEKVETAYQILFRISCLNNPEDRIEDLLIRLVQIDKDN